MSSDFDPGALLASSYPVAGALRVRLRLARPHDGRAVAGLVAGCATRPDELTVGRLVRFDPRRSLVLCATALLDGAETVVGVGALELRDPALEPWLLCVEERGGEALESLLAAALVGHARRLAA